MKITLTVGDVNVDVFGATKAVNDPKLWKFAAVEWHRLYAKFVPMDTGALRDTVLYEPGKVTHYVPYARYIYEGTGLRFRTDKNPLASAHWDKHAAPTELPKLAKAVQGYINRGGIRFE